jgi:nucleoside-diphosphate-sugar epimerase
LKVLVTGGAGFIGSNLVRSLLARGDSVRVLDSFATGKRANLEEIDGDVELVEADIRSPQVCAAACAGVEAVFHQAAIGSVPLSIKDPLLTHQVNVDGTLNMLIAARDQGARRFVFASSSSVYGDAPERVKVETLAARPQSPYASSKLAGEAYTIVFAKAYGLEAIALRYFNIFGPRQDPESMYAAVVPRFATRLLAGKAPEVFGDGEQTRDFTFVENVVRANLLALEAPVEACATAYNIACGQATSINDLFRLMRERVGG